MYSTRTFKNIICSLQHTKAGALQVRRNACWQQDRFWETIKPLTEMGGMGGERERERGERCKGRERESRGKTSSCPKQSDSCQPANQLSSALTNLDVVLYTSVCVLMQIWPRNSVCVPRSVCLTRLDSVDRSLSEDWQLWHTLCCMEDTCCHSRFSRAPSPVDRWAEWAAPLLLQHRPSYIHLFTSH